MLYIPKSNLGKVHFKREKNLINMIKNRRKSSKVKSAIHSRKVPRNVLYYVKCKLAECGDKYSFVQYNSFVSKIAKELVKEPPRVQSKYIDSLHRLQDDKISSLHLKQSLANYNNKPFPWPKLTHWGRDQIDTFTQTTFSSAFFWTKIFEFRLKFHWSLFLRVQLTIFQHWFR